MGLPDRNPLGYVNASISNVTAFNNVDYLVAHGSGDDNGKLASTTPRQMITNCYFPPVHFANTAHLLDMFTRERIRGFRFRMFTDR
jgi:dipeptidyl aminopeptidase